MCAPKSPTREHRCQLPRWVRGREGLPVAPSRRPDPRKPGDTGEEPAEKVAWTVLLLLLLPGSSLSLSLPAPLKSCSAWRGPRHRVRARARNALAQQSLKNWRKRVSQEKNSAAMGPMSYIILRLLGMAPKERHKERCSYGIVCSAGK